MLKTLKKTSIGELVQWYLERESNPDECYDLSSGINILGRQPDCQVLCDDLSISRKHCKIRVSSTTSKVYITDLSNNGTYLNVNKLRKGEETELFENIKIGLAAPFGFSVVGVEIKKYFVFELKKRICLDNIPKNIISENNIKSRITEVKIKKENRKSASKLETKSQKKVKPDTNASSKNKIDDFNKIKSLKDERKKKLRELAFKNQNIDNKGFPIS